MKTRRIAIALGLMVLAVLSSQAAEPAGYYTAVLGLKGAALRTALHQRIRAHTVVSYSNATNALKVTDEDPRNTANVKMIYGGISRSKASFGSSSGQWNREHTWPNSLGIDDSGPEYSDLFHLRPADVQVNSARGNMFYDESGTGTGYHNPAHVNAPLCTEDADSWEPPANEKGDIARGLLYLDVRYEGTSGEPNLQLTNNASLITTANAYMGMLDTILIWHFLDPVDDAERARNDKIYTLYQHNRNPFIDRPDFVTALYGDVLALKVARVGNQLRLSWPAVVPETMRLLETSTDLKTWATSSPITSVVGNLRVATISFSGARRYYRLRLVARDG